MTFANQHGLHNDFLFVCFFLLSPSTLRTIQALPPVQEQCRAFSALANEELIFLYSLLKIIIIIINSMEKAMLF